MNIHTQERQGLVILSAAKDLDLSPREILRCAQDDRADGVREGSVGTTARVARPHGATAVVWRTRTGDRKGRPYGTCVQFVRWNDALESGR